MAIGKTFMLGLWQGLAPLCLLGAAACGPAEDPAPTAPSSAPSGQPAPDTVDRLPIPASLAGEWRVAGIDGESFDKPVGLALSADDREVWWNPRCAGLVRRYTIHGQNFRAGPLPSSVPPPSPGTPPPPVCAIGLPPHLVDAVRAMDAATQIRRTPPNGIELGGGGHSLLLYAQ